MKVEIWSDVVCPFCYVGKRKFEAALAGFAHRAEVEVIWRSFELTPDYQPVPGRSVHASLAEKKGISEVRARQMSDQMTAIAAEVGLRYDFDRAVPANTFLVHQFIHLAAAHGLQDAAEERAFAAYYTEGQNLGDLETLVALGREIGLDAEEIRATLTVGTYADAVRHDEYQARQIGVGGVPFFVFDDKYAVSGAQPTDVFAEVLTTVWAEQQPALAGDEAAACGLESGIC